MIEKILLDEFTWPEIYGKISKEESFMQMLLFFCWYHLHEVRVSFYLFNPLDISAKSQQDLHLKGGHSEFGNF